MKSEVNVQQLLLQQTGFLCYSTVNTPGLDAVPPAVVITILPVFAPVGTIAVTFLSVLT